MKIAVASGKGGTGKTTVSVALALTAPKDISLLDCDVEEPNGHIFFELEKSVKEYVSVPVPSVDEASCISCGKCSEICQFNAIVFFGAPLMVFNELCHSCGGCSKVCPASAIKEVPNIIGKITSGKSGRINFSQGCLNIGFPMAVPLIKQVLKKAEEQGDTVIDSPPGTSCSMMTAVKKSDFVIMVTEPTPFALNDMQIAVKTVRKFSVPVGVIINKSGSGDEGVERYCKDNDLKILMKIPFSSETARICSMGGNLIEAVPELKEEFVNLWEFIKRTTGGEK